MSGDSIEAWRQGRGGNQKSSTLTKSVVRTPLAYTGLRHGQGLVSIYGQMETEHCSVMKARPGKDRPLTSVQPAPSCFRVGGQLL